MKKNSFGFTLIELLVAIAIGMLIVGFGTLSLNNFSERQKVESTAEEVLANLRLARNYAITNQLPSDSPANTDRVAVVFDSNGLMTIKTQKKDNTDAGYTFFSKDITPNNISITVDKTIKFTVTDGRSIDKVVNVRISGTTSSKNIKIDESGSIYEE